MTYNSTQKQNILSQKHTIFIHPKCGAVAAVVGAAFQVSAADLNSETRSDAHAAFARQSAMYLAHVALGISLSEVAKAFGRDRSTAAHACRVVEERREDPNIDALLSRLERACNSMTQTQFGGSVRS